MTKKPNVSSSVHASSFRRARTGPSRQVWLLSVLLAVLVAASAGCEPFLTITPDAPTALAPATPTATSVPEATAPPPEPEAQISFRVETPANTPSGEVIYLSVLDEVTGLALNAKLYEMQPEETQEGAPRLFTLTLPFTMGSAVQYRYERQSGGATVSEHLSDGSPVRYRLYHVEGPGQVEDVISSWTDTSFEAPTGRITGKATDANTGSPLPNLLVSAGGAQTFTTADGAFLLEGLPPGVHNLVALALDGSYRTFQQGARVAADSTTPADLKLAPAPMVNVVFAVRLPADTPPVVPVRLAGNLYQLGNTFANLTGGSSSMATNMPVMGLLPDGRHTITLALPAGSDIRYKYTLGDGFWNAEHNADGSFRLRQLVVPEENFLIEDEVVSWHSGSQAPITFDLTVPADTPPDDSLSLQLNPLFGWTEPIPMWSLGPGRWAYVLYSPLNLPGDLHYRYCRNGQCDSADDAATAGSQSTGRTVRPGQDPQILKDVVESWAWTQPETPYDVVTPTINARGPDFMAGVEFEADYHPSWRARLPNILNGAQSLGINWLVLSPTWTFTRNSPPVLAPVAGQDALWFDLTQEVDQSRSLNINVALNPTPRFPISANLWWQTAPRDYSWWLVWFDQYRTFLLHHADLAARTGAPALILGGEWVSPALPDGKLADGTPSGVPLDAEIRWRNLIAEIRSHYNGKLLWALPYNRLRTAPPFLDAIDQIYLLWSIPLSTNPDASAAEMDMSAAFLLDNVALPIYYLINKPFILAVAYPSANGGITGCLPDGQGGCLSMSALTPSNPDNPTIQLDLQEQADAYAAILGAVNGRNWISGLVSRGYYPPAALQDKSASVNGKPAAEVLRAWFPALVGPQQ